MSAPHQARSPEGPLGLLRGPGAWPYLLSPMIAVAVVCKLASLSDELIFVTSAIGLIPAAALMGRATEELSIRSGPGVGALLNVTFANAPELIIALFALGKGLDEVVKASLIGSILGNILLVLGAAMLAGGIGRKKQLFNAAAASAQTSMLLLAAAAFVLPAIFAMVEGGGLPSPGAQRVSYSSTVDHLSVAISVVLLLTYGVGLLFSLRTHRAVFNPPFEGAVEPGWSARAGVAMLALSAAAIALLSALLVGSISHASRSVGLSQFFIGAIVVAIVGNAAEHWVAVLAALKNKMDLAVNIAIGSSAQIALFVAPVLVLCSLFLGPGTLALVFNGFELVALLLALLIAISVTVDGESNWFEGVQLLAVYAVLGITFYYA